MHEPEFDLVTTEAAMHAIGVTGTYVVNHLLNCCDEHAGSFFASGEVPTTSDGFLIEAVRLIADAAVLDAFTAHEASSSIDQCWDIEPRDLDITHIGHLPALAQAMSMDLAAVLMGAVFFERFGELPDADDDRHGEYMGAVLGTGFDGGAIAMKRGYGIGDAWSHLVPLFTTDPPTGEQRTECLLRAASGTIVAIAAKSMFAEHYLSEES